MHIVVVGLGEVGKHLLRVLQEERHDIVAIDHDPTVVQACEDAYDVMTLQGYGASPAVLTKAGAGTTDLLVAVTDQDEVNLVAAATAKQLGARQAVARVQGREWTHKDVAVQYGFLGIDAVVNPQVLVAEELALIARSHGALDVFELAEHRVALTQVSIRDNARLAGKSLAKLRATLPRDTLVAAVVRSGELFIPGGGDVLMAHDRVYLVGKTEQVDQAQDLFTRVGGAHRVALAGGSVVGEALARQLHRHGMEVLIIERDRARAEELSARLEGVTVLHGDGTDLELLRDEDIAAYDLFAAMYAEDQHNLLAGLLARKGGAPRTAALVHRPGYMEIYRQLGIDVVLSPRLVCFEHILKYCRQTSLQSVRVLEEGQAEVFEIVAPGRCRAVGVPLARLRPPRGVLIAAILRSNRNQLGQDAVVIPTGADTILPGDTVIVLATHETRPQVERLFRERAL